MGEVFTPTVLKSLGQGDLAVGHVRYGTTGTGGRSNAQPMLVNHIKGRMALAHNGNLTNSTELRTELELQGSIFHSTSDTEVISYIITKERIGCGSIEEAVEKAMNRLEGAYSLCIMSPSKLIAARGSPRLPPIVLRPDRGRHLCGGLGELRAGRRGGQVHPGRHPRRDPRLRAGQGAQVHHHPLRQVPAHHVRL